MSDTISRKICFTIQERLDEILKLRDKFVSKEDGSYVSEGDLLVQSIIIDLLSKLLPAHELISEEMAPFDDRIWQQDGSYVVLDPIDGTENFVSGLREWGVGFSIYTQGQHQESCIFLPELKDIQVTGMQLNKFRSRIQGLSSSLSKGDIQSISFEGFEYRIIGCSMYNTLAAVRGSFAVFENVKGVNCWDVLPGLNLALEHGCNVEVDGAPYLGELLFPTRKYRVKISN